MINEPTMVYIDPDVYLDVLSLGEFLELVAQTMEKGFGKVTFEVLVQEGRVKTVTLTKSNTIFNPSKVDNQRRKE